MEILVDRSNENLGETVKFGGGVKGAGFEKWREFQICQTVCQPFEWMGCVG